MIKVKGLKTSVNFTRSISKILDVEKNGIKNIEYTLATVVPDGGVYIAYLFLYIDGFKVFASKEVTIGVYNEVKKASALVYETFIILTTDLLADEIMAGLEKQKKIKNV